MIFKKKISSLLFNIKHLIEPNHENAVLKNDYLLFNFINLHHYMFVMTFPIPSKIKCFLAFLVFPIALQAVTPNEATSPGSSTKDDMVLVEGGTLRNKTWASLGKSVKTFYIGRTEVTWLEWKKVREWAADHGYDIGNAGAGSGDNHPVRDIDLLECLKWCNARSEMEGLQPVYLVKGGYVYPSDTHEILRPFNPVPLSPRYQVNDGVYRSGDYYYKANWIVTMDTRVGKYAVGGETVEGRCCDYAGCKSKRISTTKRCGVGVGGERR